MEKSMSHLSYGGFGPQEFFGIDCVSAFNNFSTSYYSEQRPKIFSIFHKNRENISKIIIIFARN